MSNTWIIGGGMTGLAVGITSGFNILEEKELPGGLCTSYYINPRTGRKDFGTQFNERFYRFEIGGGHWIFGGDIKTLKFLDSIVKMRHYTRRSGVFFAKHGLLVPYPLQYHLRYFNKTIIKKILNDFEEPISISAETIYDWVFEKFGSTLGQLFFGPFHELYTAGLWRSVRPEYAYKTPMDLAKVREGMISDVPITGYNSTFRYPEGGLNFLAKKMAELSIISFSSRVTSIDTDNRLIFLADGAVYDYRRIVTTIPLCNLVRMTDLILQQHPDPYSSVLVLNIGAERGLKCPDEHWLYIPDSRSGFFRIGFYSNVDSSFLPDSHRKGNHVSLYVERALQPDQKPTSEEIGYYTKYVIEELRDWGFIKRTEVVDSNWIEVAYTWCRPNSYWREEAINKLESLGIYPIGRYGRWHFQGIADSIHEGLTLGSEFS